MSQWGLLLQIWSSENLIYIQMIIILYRTEPKQAILCWNILNLIKLVEFKVLFAVCHWIRFQARLTDVFQTTNEELCILNML